MKKTLITLLAMAGVAMAGVDGDWTATFTTSDQSKDQTWEDYSAAFETGAPLTLDFTGLIITGNTKNGVYTADAPGSMNPSAIRPNANVCASDAASYVLTCSLKNTSDERMDITAITFASFGYNSSGNAHGNNNNPTASYVLSYKAGADSEYVTLGSQSAEVFSTAEVAYDLAENFLTLEANSSVEFSLSVSKVNGNGSFVGLTGATFSIIPEPATATLSLLALAGLAVRRRRK